MYASAHNSTIYDSQNPEAPEMSINRWMDKEYVARMSKGILLSRKKRGICVGHREIEETRVCHTVRSDPERERQTWYINAQMWNLEKQHWGTCLRGRGGEADVENGPVDAQGKERHAENAALTCLHVRAWNGQLVGGCQITRGDQPGPQWWPRGGGRAETQEGGCINMNKCTIMADSIAVQQRPTHRKAAILQLK